ncbi:MAG TPA: bifunctional 2-keto-4-hydroxyglutarate aldolase/2-keto-3-deoxy-6-phosphogluconate aldolase, partial [Clostridiales bacterium]|nr:bifunctional 2-keto-4-hydroxyglutarate aldolase/2-keto-3-deoxy-6-phosphogluconate aldolase [Clostridiales bacterium]
PHGVFMPTGGVDTENVAQWIKAGAFAVGVGGSLTAGAKKGDYEDITNKAKILIERIAEARVSK